MWTKSSVKLPPACRTVLVRRFPVIERGQLTTKYEMYYVSTRPRECVEDDNITHWQIVQRPDECYT